MKARNIFKNETASHAELFSNQTTLQEKKLRKQLMAEDNIFHFTIVIRSEGD